MWKKFTKALENRYENNKVYTRSQMINRDLALLWLLLVLTAILCGIGYMLLTSSFARFAVALLGGALMTVWAVSTLVDN